ncbi:hypothetical protein AOLI_G00158880 [Acnodon oligacanthus]
MAEIASAIIAGVSLLGTTIEQISRNVDTDRNVAIQISNFSKQYILKNPRVFTSAGYSHSPPQPTVRKGTMESCSFTKNPEKTYGCVGVLTYDACADNKSDTVKRLAIMFSVPYNYTQYESWFALGLFDASRSCDESLFNMMVITTSGYTHSPPQPTARKETRESCPFTKRPHTACGSAGVLTYDICMDNKSKAIKHLAIMFSVPYDYNQYENRFALGLFDSSQSCDESLFNMMYNGKGSFIRDKCSSSE